MGLRLPIAASAALVALLGWAHHAHAATLHHAALVVEHSSGQVLTRCVAFLEDQITGMQLIQQSHVEYQTQQFGGLGPAICQLDYEPQQIPAGCFGTGAYWQYFHRSPSGWNQSAAGASSWSLHDGDMDGWRYASGAGQTPVNISFNSVCAAPAPSPAPVVATPVARAAQTVPSRASPPPAATTTTPSPSLAATSLEAMAPTDSPRAQVALARTGPPKAASPAAPLAMWLLLGGAGIVLIALGAVNYLRRGP